VTIPNQKNVLKVRAHGFCVSEIVADCDRRKAPSLVVTIDILDLDNRCLNVAIAPPSERNFASSLAVLANSVGVKIKYSVLC
jgi:hypothetical protein